MPVSSVRAELGEGNDALPTAQVDFPSSAKPNRSLRRDNLCATTYMALGHSPFSEV